MSMQTGKLVSESESMKAISLHLVTDCRSLFDHIHREGIPKAPADKRLAVDLAGIRQALMREGRWQWRERYGDDSKVTPEKPCRPPLHWLPTNEQLADMLTKRLKPETWWRTLASGTIQLPLLRRGGAKDPPKIGEEGLDVETF